MTADLASYARDQFEGVNSDQHPRMLYLWRWFGELTDWRDTSFGVGPLSHQEIESWSRLLQIDITPFEVDVLRRLDREYRLYRNEKDNPSPPSIGEQLRAVAEAEEAAKTMAKKKIKK